MTSYVSWLAIDNLTDLQARLMAEIRAAHGAGPVPMHPGMVTWPTRRRRRRR